MTTAFSCPHTLYLVRHGETDWNVRGLLQGSQDIPLNSLGRQQATRAGDNLNWLLPHNSPLDFISSPLQRARETMQLLRQQLGLPPGDYRCDGRLKEISFGDWEGLSWAQIHQQEPERYQQYLASPVDFPMPNGECWQTVFDRISSLLASLQRDSLLVGHSIVLKAFLAVAGGIDPRQLPPLHMPQDRILVMRQGQFAWLQATGTADGQPD